jgi:phosphopantetheine--protein transferase-like protein
MIFSRFSLLELVFIVDNIGNATAHNITYSGIDIETTSSDRILKVSHKFLSEKEKEILYSSNPRLAGYLCWCAKEAIYKALGIPDIDFRKDIEILTDYNGVPKVIINDKKYKRLNVKVSMSHCNDNSSAFAIITKTEK